MTKESKFFVATLICCFSGAFTVAFLPFLLVGPPDWWDHGPHWWPFALFSLLSLISLTWVIRLRDFDQEKIHCCEEMRSALEFECSQHADAHECPDSLLIYSEKLNEYGLLIHDGGTSWVLIQFCPWCGEHLPESTRG